MRKSLTIGAALLLPALLLTGVNGTAAADTTVHVVTAAEMAAEVPPAGTVITLPAAELARPAGQAVPDSIAGYPGVPSICANVNSSFRFGAVNAEYGNGGPDERFVKPGRFCVMAGGYDREFLYYTASSKRMIDVVCPPGSTACTEAWGSAYSGAWQIVFDQFCDMDVEVGTEASFTTYSYGAKEYDNALCTGTQFSDPLFRVQWDSTSKYNNGEGVSWERP